MTCLLATVQLLKPFISCFVAHSIFSCSQRGFFGVYRFYVKAVNPNITFGARDFYVLSVLLDSICFCLFVLGFSSFGVSVCTYVHTYFCVHLSVSLSVFVCVCVLRMCVCVCCVCACVRARTCVCVSPPNDTSPLPTLLSSILPSLSPHPWPHPMTPPPLSSLLPPSSPPLALLSSSMQLGRGEVQQVATYIQQSTVPLPFLIVLLLQFLSMLVDRFIYLRKSLPMKLIFNVLLIIAWHAYLFFILPVITDR